jgi:hypothetical protein
MSGPPPETVRRRAPLSLRLAAALYAVWLVAFAAVALLHRIH